MARAYCIYVNPTCGFVMPGSFMMENGGLTPDRRKAKSFKSILDAAAEIKARGWEDTTMKRPGVTTAYVADFY